MESVQALIVLDVQNAIFQLPVPLFEPDLFVGNIRRLTSNARAKSIPVILLQHCGSTGGFHEKSSPGWQLHASLDHHPNDIVVEKSNPDACHGTSLEEELRKLGVENLAVCGFATAFCVDTTVRSLFAKDFKVTLASDAHTTTDGEVLSAKQSIDHHNWVLKRFATVVPTADIKFAD